MKKTKKSTLIFIFSILLFLPICLNSQDSIRKLGLRVGYDVSNLAFNFFNNEVDEQELLVDFGIGYRLFLATEGGYSIVSYSPNETGSLYKLNGYFVRVGIDYDLLKKGNNLFVFGLRYSMSSFKHSVSNILITNEYWGKEVTNIPGSRDHANWITISSGLKVEIFSNFYLGFLFQGNILLSNYEDSLRPYYIPGFGKTNKNASLGTSYFLSYMIPFGKVKNNVGNKE
ncbi:MAG: DUF6048 family protein [bacterium]